MSLLRTWAPYFRTSVRTQGRSLQSGGKVTLLSAGEQERVRASVEAEQSHTITIDDDGQATCTCDGFAEGVYCEHIWAVLIHADESQARSCRIDDLTPSLPKAGKRQSKRVEVREPDWIGRLSLLRPSSNESAGREMGTAHHHLCYVIQAERSNSRGGLIVQLYLRPIGQPGLQGVRPFKLGYNRIEQLDDAADREIAATIVGARRFYIDDLQMVHTVNQDHGIFQVQPAVQRPMLEAMIATGRCFLDAGRSSPVQLHWDAADDGAAWCVHLVVAKGLADGLEVRIELRRDNGCMAIDAPSLVIAGQGGLVCYEDKAAVLDDRGATKWRDR